MSPKGKILVLAGGRSEEREVSLASGKAICEALVRLGYSVEAVDSATGKPLLDKEGRYALDHDRQSLSKIAMKEKNPAALIEAMDLRSYADNELVFLALHGGEGENGTIQTLLDIGGINYTGSGRLASAVAMNKAFTKRILENENIPTPAWLLLKIRDSKRIDRYCRRIEDEFGFPIIVKPNDSGSTIGLSLVNTSDKLKDALLEAARISPEILIEQYIRGREITAAVLDSQPLPLVEIIPSGELYDYRCKYTKGGSQYVCPAEIPEKIAADIQKLAAAAFEIVGCSGLARIDFILDDSHRPYFLEINTLPGMTELSLAPMAAAQAGLDFDSLVEKICASAKKK